MAPGEFGIIGADSDGVQVASATGSLCDRGRVANLKFEKPGAVRFMFQVTQIVVRFLLERGLRFRNLGVCGHDST